MCLDSNLTCEHITGDGNLDGSILREAGFTYGDYCIDIYSIILGDREERGYNMFDSRDLCIPLPP